MRTEGTDLYSKKLGLRFFHIPKNAMMSVIRGNNKALGFEWTLLTDIPKETKIFCILRDPFDKFVSSFYQVIIIFGGDESRKRTTEYKKILKRIRDCNTISEKISTYINEIQNNGFFDSHIYPQTHFLNYEKFSRNINMVDHFLDFSNLETELKSLIGDSALFLEHHNKGKTNELKKYFEPYRSQIENLYKEDYNMYINKFPKYEDI